MALVPKESWVLIGMNSLGLGVSHRVLRLLIPVG